MEPGRLTVERVRWLSYGAPCPAFHSSSSQETRVETETGECLVCLELVAHDG